MRIKKFSFGVNLEFVNPEKGLFLIEKSGPPPPPLPGISWRLLWMDSLETSRKIVLGMFLWLHFAWYGTSGERVGGGGKKGGSSGVGRALRRTFVHRSPEGSQTLLVEAMAHPNVEHLGFSGVTSWLGRTDCWDKATFRQS